MDPANKINEFSITLAEWVKARRRMLDLTQAELAERAGCTVFALRKIESGERRPSKQLAALIAKALEVQPDELPAFLKVARGELSATRLPSVSKIAEHPAVSLVRVSAQPADLPTQAGPLIGRQSELHALGELLRNPQCRLVTLTGPGGIGKTCLAIETVSQNAILFPDGAYFISLASINSAAFLVPAIAGALGLSLSAQADPRRQLLSFLSPKRMLLMLDNAEHLLDSVGLFAEIIAQAPQLKLLVTSREQLNLLGEWVFEVPGLPVPPSDPDIQVSESSAVALFIQSARRAQASFDLRSGDLQYVARICRLLDGLPLGIELAAAWVPVLSCQEIAREIERGLDFLSTSARNVPERQRSLRAAFDYSWNLLPKNERSVLSQLCIFHGGFTRAAAEQVVGASLFSLRALSAKSLLRRRESGRYELHESIRQFAYSHLAETTSYETMIDRYAQYYLALLADRERALKSASQCDAIHELVEETGNLRAAWAWAVKRRQYAWLSGALRSLGVLCSSQGWMQEGINLLEMLVDALRTVDDSHAQNESLQLILGQALAQQGQLYFRKGEFEQALSLLEDSLSLVRPFDAPGPVADQLIISGTILHLVGEFQQAVQRIEEGLACAEAVRDDWYAAYARFNLGYLASLSGRYEEGYAVMQAGLAAWRELGDPSAISLGLNYISPTAIYLGRYSEAEAFLQEGLKLATQVGDRWAIGTAHRNLGLAALSQGKLDEARSQFEQGLDCFNEYVIGWDIACTQIYMGETSLAYGDAIDARERFQRALHTAMQVRSHPLALEALLGLSAWCLETGDPHHAASLAAFVQNHPRCQQPAKDRAGQLLARVNIHAAPEPVNSTLEEVAAQWLAE